MRMVRPIQPEKSQDIHSPKWEMTTIDRTETAAVSSEAAREGMDRPDAGAVPRIKKI